MPIIPSIDLLNGHAVQLVGGKVEELKVDAGDPRPIAKRFGVAGDIAVVDLDAALGRGNNRDTIIDLLRLADCRVGGGIRSVESAIEWLNLGAAKVVLGTAATVEVLRQLPRERVVAALDAVHGEVVVKGWTTKTGVSVFDRMKELSPYVSGFLVTLVEREGRMEGLDWSFVEKLKASACGVDLTIAGGVTTVDDVAKLDAMGIEAQVGMALYTHRMDLGEAIAATIKTDRPDCLFTTVVVDESRKLLGQVYSSRESIVESVKTMKGVYQSRNRGLWRKGETSGATQDLLRIEVDCDRDSVCFVVHQNGRGFCHREKRSCFGRGVNSGISQLEETLVDRLNNPTEGSYTNRLFRDDALLRSKLFEEAEELMTAKDAAEAAWEAADVIYFAMVTAVKKGATLKDIERHLDLRSMRVTRRAGDAKVVQAPPVTEISREEARRSEEIQPTTTRQLRLLTPAEVSAAADDPLDEKVLAISRDIVDDVAKHGQAALLKHAVRLGDIKEGQRFIVYPEEMKRVFDSLPSEQQDTLRRTADRIRKFAQSQRNCITDLTTNIEGGKAGHTVEACERAGCYAPGGRFPLPSSVLMTAITARVAGVKQVWVASPRPAPVTIAAAHLAGADALLCVGGAQAIGALAFGTEEIPAVDVLVGPGNKFVTAAKQLVSGRVKIDMLAGPSECLVIADDTADPSTVAADLLAQAEHDPDARPILITTSSLMADQVDDEITRQLEVLPTADIARQAVKNGFTVICKDLDEAARVSDIVAPEHLEVHTADAWEYSKKLRHYGGLFIGHLSGEVLGDYGAGPNHVLPTGATARNSGGLSVFTFLRIRTFIYVDDAASSQLLARDARDLALLEGLHGHSAAAIKRILPNDTSALSPSRGPITRLLRDDLNRLERYKPIKPLDVVAAEIGISVENLVKLDGNENSYGPHQEVRDAIGKSELHIYPDPGQTHLRRELSKFCQYPEDWIVSGSGSDDILDIVIRMVDPQAIYISSPTFGMYNFLGKISKATIIDVPRRRDNDFAFDTQEFISVVKSGNFPRKVVFLPSPNNPTGDVIPNDDVARLCTELDCLVVIDEAYAEFSKKSSLDLVRTYDNLVVARTFSKWAGLAGLRLGFAVGHPSVIDWMMALKQPYNVNIAADVAGRISLQKIKDINVTVDLLLDARDYLIGKIGKISWLKALPTEANFVLVEVLGFSAADLASYLRQRGILIRYFSTAALSNFIRISAGKMSEMDAVLTALEEYRTSGFKHLKPEAIILDMDGVMVDVSSSYRQAIINTAAHWGVQVTGEDITQAKMAGNANNDWVLTQRLLSKSLPSPPPLSDVTRIFEEFYQGTEGREGLWKTERCLIAADLLTDLSSKFPLAIVTGRPRSDARKFLEHNQLSGYFSDDLIVCMEDAPAKPDPQPVQLALRKLGVKRAVMIGDTPDDCLSATRAGVSSLGILAPQEKNSQLATRRLIESGAAGVISSLEDLRKFL